MKTDIQILGDGAFGSFLKDFLCKEFNVLPCTERDFHLNNSICNNILLTPIILAVPVNSLKEVAMNYIHRHIVNVCSVQKNSNEILKSINANNFTSIHPLFGKRTPENMRHLIFTNHCIQFKESEDLFINSLSPMLSSVTFMSDIEHDIIMAKTHVTAVIAAKQMKIFIERAKDIQDHLLPNSFRLLKNFVQTLDDMPKGTLDTILSNHYG